MLKRSGEEIKSNFAVESLPQKMSEYQYSLMEDIGPKDVHQYYFANRKHDGLRASPHNRVACFEKN